MFSFLSCKEKTISEKITVNYYDGKGVSVSLYHDSGNSDFNVFLKSAPNTPVLGEFTSEGTTTTFRPIVPFEAGQTYLLKGGRLAVGEFTVNRIEGISKPKLLAIYPSTDTVPQNLLKMYFVFSEPMQEVGKALDFVSVTNLNTQEEVSVFLELPTELWNEDHTQLTLWLDPGRIKTGLIPNKEKGLPILEGNRYEIKLSPRWQSAQGIALAKEFVKQITVVESDLKKPSLDNWKLEMPKHSTRETLKIHFGEPMDAMLGAAVLQISHADEIAMVAGDYSLRAQERVLEFMPEEEWRRGDYTITVTRHLEDLAGNSPMHLFDTEVSLDAEDMKHEKFIDVRSFTIE